MYNLSLFQGSDQQKFDLYFRRELLADIQIPSTELEPPLLEQPDPIDTLKVIAKALNQATHRDIFCNSLALCLPGDEPNSALEARCRELAGSVNSMMTIHPYKIHAIVATTDEAKLIKKACLFSSRLNPVVSPKTARLIPLAT